MVRHIPFVALISIQCVAVAALATNIATNEIAGKVSDAWTHFFRRWVYLMPDVVEKDEFYSDNEGELDSGIPMPQERWPIIVQSISGIPEEDWDVFKARCKADGVTQGKAMEIAVADLAISMRRGDRIDWRPSKAARARPVRMHDDTINEVRELVGESGFLQNVIFGTAMYRWATRE